jgi:hypothetical protein
VLERVSIRGRPWTLGKLSIFWRPAIQIAMAGLIAFLACTGARPTGAQQRNEQPKVGLRLFVIEMRHYGPDDEAFGRLSSFVLAWSSGADRVVAMDSTQGFGRELVASGQAPDEERIRRELQRLRVNTDAPNIDSTLAAISRHIERHWTSANAMFDSLCPTDSGRCPAGTNTIEIVLAAQQYNQTADFNGMIEFPTPSCLDLPRYVDPTKLSRPRKLNNGMPQIVRLVIATDVVAQKDTDTSPQIVDLFHHLAARQGAEYIGTAPVLSGSRQPRRTRQSPTPSGRCALTERTWPALPKDVVTRAQPPGPTKSGPPVVPSKTDTPSTPVPPAPAAPPQQAQPTPRPPAPAPAPPQQAQPAPLPPAQVPAPPQQAPTPPRSPEVTAGAATPAPPAPVVRRPEPPAPAQTGTSAPRISYQPIGTPPATSPPSPPPTPPVTPPSAQPPGASPRPTGAVLTVRWRLPKGATLNLTRSGTIPGGAVLEDIPFHPGTARDDLHIREFLFPAAPAKGRVKVRLMVQGTCTRGNNTSPIRLMLEQQTPGIRWRAGGRDYLGHQKASLPVKCVPTASQPGGQVQLDPANAALEFWQ